MRGLDRVVAMRGHHHPYDQPVFWTRSIYDCLDLCLDHLSSTWILLSIPPIWRLHEFWFFFVGLQPQPQQPSFVTLRGAGLPLLIALDAHINMK